MGVTTRSRGKTLKKPSKATSQIVQKKTKKSPQKPQTAQRDISNETEIVAYETQDKDFKKYMEKITKKGSFDDLCMGGVSFDYFKANMAPKATHMWILKRSEKTRTGEREIMISILLGYSKDTKTTFYVDLLCSNKERFFNQKGVGEYFFKTTMKRIEEKGYKLVALRAAMPWHVTYYKKFGFRRLVDACDTTITESLNLFKPLEAVDKIVLDGQDETVQFIAPQKYRKSKKAPGKNEKVCDFVKEGARGPQAKCWLADGYWMSKCFA